MLESGSRLGRGTPVPRLLVAGMIFLAAVFAVFFWQEGSALAVDEEGCLICHGDPNFEDSSPDEGEGPRSLYVDPASFKESVHGTNACSSCHRGFLLTIPKHTDASQEGKDFRQVAIEACEECHQKEYQEYLTSDHAQKFYADHDKGPICISCHGSHEVRAVNMHEETADFKMSMAEDSCGRCHMDKFEKAKHEFHFKALSLGYDRAATCFDCHGFHTNLALHSGEPETVEACRKCHPGANEGFTYFQMHLEEGFENAWWGVRAVYYFFSTLLVVVLVTGIAYTTVHLQKEMRTILGVIARGFGRMFGYIRALEDESVRERVQESSRSEARTEPPKSSEKSEGDA
jgi:hypothetical protein